MKDRIIDIIKLLICFIIFFCIGDISSFILKIFGIDISSFSNKGIVIYQFIVSLIMFTLLFILYYKKFKEDFIKFNKNKKDNITYVIKTFIMFMILKYIVGFISIVILMIFGYDAASFNSVNQDTIETYVKVYPILMLISSAFLAPFYEEGIFRLGIKSILKNKWLFVIISGLIFGLMHIFPLDEGITFELGLIQSISYVTMGIVLAYIYYKKDNIYMSIGVHFLNNLLSILVMINMY